jgi:hypothetical protein
LNVEDPQPQGGMPEDPINPDDEGAASSKSTKKPAKRRNVSTLGPSGTLFQRRRSDGNLTSVLILMTSVAQHWSFWTTVIF